MFVSKIIEVRTTVYSMNEEPLTQAECLTAVKFARYTAATADKLLQMAMDLANKLEQAGILDPKRISRVERDEKIRTTHLETDRLDKDITEMIAKIPHHPQADQILQALLGDLKAPLPPDRYNNLQEPFQLQAELTEWHLPGTDSI